MPPDRPPVSPPFVGRSGELAVLEELVAGASAGRGGIVLVAGEPGIGKSALVERLADGLEGATTVLTGRCWPNGAPAFWPWAQALRSLCDRLGRRETRALAGSSMALLALVEPSMGRLSRTAPDVPDSTPRVLVFDAVSRFFCAAAQREPLVVVIEDAHWAGGASLALLSYIGGDVRRSHLAIVVTYRPPAFGVLADPPSASRTLHLEGLSTSELRQLLQSAGPLDDNSVARIAVAADGNPLLSLELAAALTSSESADGLEGVPVSVKDLVAQRVSTLPKATQRILGLASCTAAGLDIEIISAASATDERNAREKLRPAERVGLVGPDGKGGLRFTHAIVQDAIRECLPADERTRYNLVLAEAIETLHGADGNWQSALAHHFGQASQTGVATKAFRYAVSAARTARAQLGHEAAAHLYATAIRLSPMAGVSAPEVALVVCEQGETLSRDRRTDEAKTCLLAACTAARRHGDAHLLARAALAFPPQVEGVEVHSTADQMKIDLLREARSALATGDVSLRSRLAGALAVALYWAPVASVRATSFAASAAERDALSAESVRMARQTGEAGVLAEAILYRLHALWGPGSESERSALVSELFRVSSGISDPAIEMQARAWRVLDALEHFDGASLDREMAAAGALARRLGDPLALWTIARWESTRALLNGRLEDARTHIGDAQKLGTRAVDATAAGLFRDVALFDLLLHLGQYDLLLGPTADAAAANPEVPAYRCAHAFVLAEMGRLDDAAHELAPLIAGDFALLPRDLDWLGGMIHATRALSVLALAGDPPFAEASVLDTARRLLDPFRGRAAVQGFGTAVVGSVDRALAVLAAVRGDGADARRSFDAAIELLERCNARLLLAATLKDAAALGVLPAGGDRADRLRAEAGLRPLRSALEQAAVTVTLSRTSGMWTLSVGSAAPVHIRTSRGLRYLAELLSRPDAEVHALELVRLDSSGVLVGAHRDPVLDDRARSQYRNRIAELRDQIDEGEEWNDPERVARAQAELDELSTELARHVGLGGRSRMTGSALERARVSTTKALRRAIGELADLEPTIGAHLQMHVHTGVYCAYRPPTEGAPRWRVRM